MASIYDLKPRFQNLLRPLTRRMADRGITANQVTMLAVFLSLATGFCLWLWPESSFVQLLVPIVLFVRMGLNAIDGMLAREHHMKSRLGAVLNEIGDVVSDCGLYLPVAFLPGLQPLPVVLVVVLSVISEMTGVVAVQIGSSRRYDGPMGKSDRAFVMGLLCLLAAAGVELAAWSTGFLLFVSLLLVVTIWNRAARALKETHQP